MSTKTLVNFIQFMDSQLKDDTVFWKESVSDQYNSAGVYCAGVQGGD